MNEDRDEIDWKGWWSSVFYLLAAIGSALCGIMALYELYHPGP